MSMERGGSDTMNVWRQFPSRLDVFSREQRNRRMNLQLLRHGIGTRAAGKAAGLVLAAWMMGAGAVSGAQVATRTHLSVASETQGTTFSAKVGDAAGSPVSGGTVS